MNYLALADGAKGLLWYGMNWYGKSLTEQGPELWDAHLELIDEVKDLERFFIAPGLGTELEVEDSQRIVRANLKKTKDGESLIVALNTSQESSAEARIPVDGKEVEVVGEGRTVEVKDGFIEDRFESLSVHLYLVR